MLFVRNICNRKRNFSKLMRLGKYIKREFFKIHWYVLIKLLQMVYDYTLDTIWKIAVIKYYSRMIIFPKFQDYIILYSCYMSI